MKCKKCGRKLGDCYDCVCDYIEKPDPIVLKVVDSYLKRSDEGVKKYGTTLQENNLTFLEWLNHLQEELMDATLYIEKLKDENQNT